MQADFVGDVLLLRTPDDPEEALTVLAGELPGEQDRITVVCSAAAGRHPTLPEVLTDALAGSAVGVRLVMLGSLPASVNIVVAMDDLAGRLGKPVTVPLTPFAAGQPPPSWITCTPGLSTRYEPPWPPTTVAKAEPLSPVPEQWAALLAGRAWPHAAAHPAAAGRVSSEMDPAPGVAPAPITAPEPTRAESLPPVATAVRQPNQATPLWIRGDAWRAEDRAGLRAALNGRYDGHVRVVAKTLSEEPGLRAAGATPDLLAGLVGLRAYCVDERERVNLALRGGATDDTPAVIARGAAYGLGFLPTVLGPVFRSGRAGAGTLAGYRPGQILTEPGFLDVAMTSTRVPGATVQYVIWSVSARRLGKIGGDLAGAALFPPASRFAVLAVDRPDEPVELLRVLLCDVAGAARGGPVGGNTERVLSRMRQTSALDATELPLPPGYVAAAPGLDDTGRPYPQREMS